MVQLTYTISDARKLTGLGNTKLYEEINAGRIQAKKCGKRTLIPHSSLQTWLDSLAPYKGE